MKNSDNTILVVPSASEQQSQGARGLLGGSPTRVSLNIDTLKKNLTNFVESINTLLSDIPTVADQFKLEEIELTFEVSAEGSIQLIGGVKAGASGGITLRMKR